MSWPWHWLRRTSSTEATVDDDLTPELLDRVRTIELKARKIVDDLLLGEYHAVFRGLGIEFDELRPYMPGDEVRDIDWKTFARSGEPVIRRYREDRDLTVIFLVDVSSSLRVGPLPVTKADLAAELCAVLALAAIRNNDRVGLLLFGGAAQRYVRPSRGAKHVLRVVREVLRARPATPGTDIAAALEYLTSVQRRRATVFLLSDFVAEGFDRAIRAASRHHDIIAIRLREPLDAQLPRAGIVRVRDAETGAIRDLDLRDGRARQAHSHYMAVLDAERARLFGQAGVDEIPVMVGEDYVPALLKFFRRRARVAAS